MYLRVLRHVVKRPAFSNPSPWSKARGYYHTAPSLKISKPLRILFCGSDEFSCASLRAVYEQHKRDPGLIASIDVICRPGKPSGRDLKTIREVPIKAVAQELGLPIHEIDTFTGWEIPTPYETWLNLIICVSFGLFVPPRILGELEYGGLNVHPSILPNFRGPAPLQHSIMAGARTTGVTLQTLDRKEFDNGVILDQTPANGLRIPFGSKCTYNQLLAFVTPVAAAMLVKGLQDRVFVEPHLDVGWLKKNPKNLIHARKITPADRRVNWREHSGTTIERHFRALGRMWSLVVDDKKQRKRVVFADMELVPKPQLIVDWAKRFADKQYGPMKPTNEDKENIHFAVIDDNGYRKPRYYVVDGSAVIFACQHDGIRVNQITVEGKGKQDAATAMKNFKDWGTWKLRAVDRHINCLHKDENLGAVTWKSIPSPGKECDSEEAKKTNSPDEAYDQATDPSDAAIDPSISDKVLDQKSQAKSDGS